MAKDALLSSHPDMHLFKVQNLKSPELRGAAPAPAEAAEKKVFVTLFRMTQLYSSLGAMAR